MLGIYVPEEFQNPASPGEVIARRKTLREELLSRIVKEEDGTILNTTSRVVHPLKVVLKSEAILEILTKTTGEAASSPQHPQHSESSEHELIGDDDDIEQLQETHQLDEQSEVQETRHTGDSTKNNQREGTRGMWRLLSHDGTEFQVPKEVGTLLAELITRVRSMEEQLAHHQ